MPLLSDTSSHCVDDILLVRTVNLSLYKLFNCLPQVWGFKLQNMHTSLYPLMCICSMALTVLSHNGANKFCVVYIIVIHTKSWAVEE